MPMKLITFLLLSCLRVYRAILSPALVWLGGPLGLGCRFTPTCSQYALEAIGLHGVRQGGALAVRRLCRCHPWGGSGHDPVPSLSPKASPPKTRAHHRFSRSFST